MRFRNAAFCLFSLLLFFFFFPSSFPSEHAQAMRKLALLYCVLMMATEAAVLPVASLVIGQADFSSSVPNSPNGSASPGSLL